jgi:hypothetical protein
MARAARETLPTSVILTKDQKAFIKKVAEQESRTFSHQVRFIITGWVESNKRKGKLSGKESEKGQEGGQKDQEVGS